MKTRNLLSAILVLTVVCMSFIPNHKFQTKSVKLKTANGAMLTLEVIPAVGTGAYEYTVEVTGANPDAVGIDIPLDFNGEHTNTPITVPLSGGYGFVDNQASFVVSEVEINPGFSYDYPTYHF